MQQVVLSGSSTYTTLGNNGTERFPQFRNATIDSKLWKLGVWLANKGHQRFNIEHRKCALMNTHNSLKHGLIRLLVVVRFGSETFLAIESGEFAC